MAITGINWEKVAEAAKRAEATKCAECQHGTCVNPFMAFFSCTQGCKTESDNCDSNFLAFA